MKILSRKTKIIYNKKPNGLKGECVKVVVHCLSMRIPILRTLGLNTNLKSLTGIKSIKVLKVLIFK